MNENTSPPDGVRKPVFIAIALVVLIAGGFAVFKMRGGRTEPVVEQPTVAEPPAPKVAHVTPEPPVEQPPSEVAPLAPPTPPPVSAAPFPPRNAPAPPPVTPIPPGPEPTPETRRLVSSLANIDLSAALTPEAAAAFKQNLQNLVQNGAAAVPAIQEFLALNKDVAFDTVPGAANLLGSSSLRMSLLEALGHIGGPEALNLSVQALQSTLDPREIALLARNIDQQAPEQYREMAAAAARTALSQAGANNISGRDVGPLFDVLAQYGGPQAVADFQQAAAGQWKYYSTIALAQMQDGAGIPALIQMATDPNSPASSGRIAALQVLGQVATANPEARNALLEEARKGAIPAATWINIAAALGGDRYQIGSVDAQSIPNVRTWHLRYGNQNYYSMPIPMSPEQIQQHVGLLDQFIAANPGQAAVAVLQETRNKLQGRLPAPAPNQ